MDGGIVLADVSWPIWWMMGSAALALVGFGLGQLLQMLRGARAIVAKEAEFSVAEEALLAGWSANRRFKAFVRRRTLGSPLGNLFFWMMVVGVVLHLAFWVAAVTVLDLDAL